MSLTSDSNTIFSPIKPVAEVSDAEPFLKEASAVLGFGVFQFSTVMDVGCGTGNSSYAIASLFSNVNHVIGVDIDESRFATAKQYLDTIQYVKGNIETGEGLFQFQGIRHIVSIHCFSCLKRQKEAFNMVHTLLRPGGGAAILFAVQMDYYDLVNDLCNHSKWGQFMKAREDVIPESHDKQYDENYYIQMLTDVGFEIYTCKREERFSSYKDTSDLLNWVFSSLRFKQPLPLILMKDFQQDLLMLLKHRVVENEDNCSMHYKIMKIIVFKKSNTLDLSSKSSSTPSYCRKLDYTAGNL